MLLAYGDIKIEIEHLTVQQRFEPINKTMLSNYLKSRERRMQKSTKIKKLDGFKNKCVVRVD